MRNSTLLAGGIAAWVLCAPFAANAQATQEGADRIRLGLKYWIATNLSSPDKSFVLNFQGPIAVQPQGDAYKAVIPASELTVTNSGEADKLPIGPIEMVLTPQANGWFDTVVTIPSSYRVDGKDGKGAEVTIGSQSLRGVFAPQYAAFMTLDAKLGTVEIHPLEPGQEKAAFRIGEISVTGDSKEVGRDTYDSTALLSLKDGIFLDEKGAQLLKLDGVTLEGKAAAANLLALHEFSQKLEDLKKRYPAKAGEDVPKEFLADLGRILDGTPKLFDDFGLTYGITGLTVTPPDSPEVSRVAIANAGFGIGLSGAAKDASTFQVKLDLAKLGIEPAPPFSQFIPQDATVDVALANLPNQELWKVLTGSLSSAATVGPDQVGQMAGAQVVQALLNSNGSIEIRGIKAMSPLTSIDLTGTFKPNAKSPTLVTGQAKLVVTGLEEAVAAAKQMPDGQQAVAGLTMIQGMGKQDTVDGKQARTYDLVVTEKGEILLNGTDLKPLLGL